MTVKTSQENKEFWRKTKFLHIFPSAKLLELHHIQVGAANQNESGHSPFPVTHCDWMPDDLFGSASCLPCSLPCLSQVDRNNAHRYQPPIKRKKYNQNSNDSFIQTISYG